jgi:membrane protein DedA with SNARE-associated domain
MFEWITGFMNSMGYIAILFLMFLENVFPPIPSELIMPLAGFTASQGKLTLIGVIIAGTIGSVLGTLPLYYVGHVIGEERLKKWAEKHGKWLTVSPDDIENASRWFQRHGNIAVLVGRLVPGVRSLIAVPAGIAKMSMPLFLAYSAVGSAMWTTCLATPATCWAKTTTKSKSMSAPLPMLCWASSWPSTSIALCNNPARKLQVDLNT